MPKGVRVQVPLSPLLAPGRNCIHPTDHKIGSNMNKGKSWSTFLLIVLLILIGFIAIYLFAPELLDNIPRGTGENAVSDFFINLIQPFTSALSDIAASIGDFFAGFKLQ